MINFGFRGHDFADNKVETLIQNCRTAEVRNIQLSLRKAFPGLMGTLGSFTPAFARGFGETLRSSGITVSVLGSYIDPVHPDEAARAAGLESFREMLLFAKFMGADMVGTETGSSSQSVLQNRSEENYRLFLQSMKPLVKQAEQLGVMIGIEGVNIFTIHSPRKMKRFLDDIASPNVLVIFDPVNLFDPGSGQTQEELIDEAFDLYGERVSVLHLKDYTLRDGKKTGAKIGEGVFNFEYFFSKVKQYKPCIDAVIEDVTLEEFGSARDYLCQLYENA